VGLMALSAGLVIGGGMRAIIVTEVLQTVVLLSGSLALLVISLREVGGWGKLRSALPESHFHLLRSDDEAPYSASGVLLGYPLLAFWFHCTDQEMVQRGLSAKSLRHGQGGCVAAGVLKFLPPLAFAIPGMCARLLFAKELGFCEGCTPTPDIAFPLLVSRLMPSGLRGLMMAAMLAACGSVLASTFNSASTLFSMDVYRVLRPAATERTLVLVGRLTIAATCVFSLLWLPLVSSVSDTLFIAIQSMVACFAPSIATLFIFAMFWPRANVQGALAGLTVGHSIGTLRLVLVVSNIKPTRSVLTYEIMNMNFLNFAFALALLTSIALVAGSLLSAPPSEEQLRWTWKTRAGGKYQRVAMELSELEEAPNRVPDRGGWTAEDLGAVALLVAVLAVFSYGA